MTPPVKNIKWISYPIGDITQYFGENKNLYAFLGLNGHNGIDIVRKWGERVYAVEDGIIVDDKDDPNGYGVHVRLISMDGKREWTYGHFAVNLVKQNQIVKEGDILGAMGNTGFVISGDTPFWGTNPSKGTSKSGTHLHFGLREVRKSSAGWSYPGSSLKIDVLNYKNGFKGAIDPLPYFYKTPKASMVRSLAERQKSELLYNVSEVFNRIKI